MTNSFDTSEINITKILKRVPNRFLLSVAVAKRARQLQEGARPLIEIPEGIPMIPVITALKEIEANKIDVNAAEEQEEDIELLKKMDELLDIELAKEKDKGKEAQTEFDNKKSLKDALKKSKSKSLAA